MSKKFANVIAGTRIYVAESNWLPNARPCSCEVSDPTWTEDCQHACCAQPIYSSAARKRAKKFERHIKKSSFPLQMNIICISEAAKSSHSGAIAHFLLIFIKIYLPFIAVKYK